MSGCYYFFILLAFILPIYADPISDLNSYTNTLHYYTPNSAPLETFIEFNLTSNSFPSNWLTDLSQVSIYTNDSFASLSIFSAQSPSNSLLDLDQLSWINIYKIDPTIDDGSISLSLAFDSPPSSIIPSSYWNTTLFSNFTTEITFSFNSSLSTTTTTTTTNFTSHSLPFIFNVTTSTPTPTPFPSSLTSLSPSSGHNGTLITIEGYAPVDFLAASTFANVSFGPNTRNDKYSIQILDPTNAPTNWTLTDVSVDLTTPFVGLLEPFVSLDADETVVIDSAGLTFNLTSSHPDPDPDPDPVDDDLQLSSLSPTSALDGEEILLQGTGFTQGCQCIWSGLNDPSGGNQPLPPYPANVLNSTSAICTVPVTVYDYPSNYYVQLALKDPSTSNITQSLDFEFLSYQLLQVTPAEGYTKGDETITITGHGFKPSTVDQYYLLLSSDLGERSSNECNYLDQSSVSCQTPNHYYRGAESLELSLTSVPHSGPYKDRIAHWLKSSGEGLPFVYKWTREANLLNIYPASAHAHGGTEIRLTAEGLEDLPKEEKRDYRCKFGEHTVVGSYESAAKAVYCISPVVDAIDSMTVVDVTLTIDGGNHWSNVLTFTFTPDQDIDNPGVSWGWYFLTLSCSIGVAYYIARSGLKGSRLASLFNSTTRRRYSQLSNPDTSGSQLGTITPSSSIA